MDRLSGKRALITGGTTGIGLETARQFLREGARVMITGNNPANLETARKELGSEVTTVASNAADAKAQKALAEMVRDTFGALDVLFINAGVVKMRPIEQMDEAAFDDSFGINVKGPYFLIQALLPVFANPASIVLNGSVNAHIGMQNTTLYAATKAGLLSLTRTISGELLSRGIRVNAVSPGPTATPLLSRTGMSEAELHAVGEAIQTMVPAHRFAHPREIADAAVYLASDESSFMIGSEILIDGGMGNI